MENTNTHKNEPHKVDITQDNNKSNIKPCPDCEDNLICEKCYKINSSVRFEGSQELNLCDKCLFKMKGGLR